MNTNQKEKIEELKSLGYGYKKISSILNIPTSTISSYFQSLKETLRCPICNKKIKNTKGHRKKKYCSDSCRIKYWKQNKEKLSITPSCVFTCKYCHKKFKGYKSKNPKYCSIACYLKSRYGEDNNERK